jgi:hypothetical protein
VRSASAAVLLRARVQEVTWLCLRVQAVGAWVDLCV